jgi:hypothetical protein
MNQDGLSVDSGSTFVIFVERTGFQLAERTQVDAELFVTERPKILKKVTRTHARAPLGAI